jgi:hypothetical protein
MIEANIVVQLRELGVKVKEIAPDLNGQVIFNLAAKDPQARVEVRVCDVTGKKK